MATATVTSKGQVTIPKKIREKMNLKPGDQLDFEIDLNDVVTISPIKYSSEEVFGLLHRKGQKPKSSKEIEEKLGEFFKNKYSVK